MVPTDGGYIHPGTRFSWCFLMTMIEHEMSRLLESVNGEGALYSRSVVRPIMS